MTAPEEDPGRAGGTTPATAEREPGDPPTHPQGPGPDQDDGSGGAADDVFGEHSGDHSDDDSDDHSDDDSDDHSDDDSDDAEDLAPLVADEDVRSAVQAVLLVVDSPVTEQALAAAVGRSAGEVRELLVTMASELAESRSGIDLREWGGGWRFYTRPEFAPVVERFVLDGAQSRLSKAALESLAVIAYRQPVTRARVAAVRGVNVDGVIRTLLARGLIQEDGADPETGGILYRTTEMFLERMGLAGIDELPPLGPLLPDVDAIDDV